MMKKLLFTIGVVLTTFAASAQEVKDAAVSTSTAEISFDKKVHDFGTLEYAGNGTYEFRFKNTGKEPLIISNAQGSCGCTVPTYPKNVPIKPGDVEYIKVTYDTKRPGAFTKTVTITSNAKNASETITIKGTVQPAPTEEAFPANGKKETGAVPFEKH